MPSESDRRGEARDATRSRASAKLGRLTIIEADVTTPASAASIIPMLTPREIPKSSALMMSCFGLGVDPTRTIQANAKQVHQHPRPMPGKRDSTRLVGVVKIDWDLLDLQAVKTRDEEAFDIEAETAQSLTREDYLRGMSGESLESCLGVQNSGQENLLRQSVEETAHQVPGVEIVKKSRAHHVS